MSYKGDEQNPALKIRVERKIYIYIYFRALGVGFVVYKKMFDQKKKIT